MIKIFRSWVPKLITSLLLILLLAGSFNFPLNKAHASGTTYYVDNTITDTHVASATPDCTNYDPIAFTCSGASASAYKTIADINAGSFNPDDQILFRKGQTWREQLTVPSSGSAGHSITFGSFGSGSNPKIYGSSLVTGWSALAGSAPISSDGFEVGDTDLTDGDGAYWTSGAKSASGATLVGNDTVTKDAGTYSAKVTITAPSKDAYAYHTVTGNNDTYVQYRVNVGTMTGSAGNQTELAAIGGEAAGTASYLTVIVKYVTSTTYTLSINFHKSGADQVVNGTTVFNTGTWNTIEAHYKVDGTAGGGELWVNGTAEISALSYNTLFASSQPTRVSVGTEWTVWTGQVNIDSYKFGNSYMGQGVSNVWLKSGVTTQPNVVWLNNVNAISEPSLASLTAPGEFFWSGNTLYLYSTTNPDVAYSAIEVPQRNYAILLDGLSNVQLSNIDTLYANSRNIRLQTTASNITLDGVNSQYCDVSCINVQMNSDSSGINIKNGDISYSLGYGVQGGDYASGMDISHMTVHNTSLITGFTGGIYIGADGTASNNIVEYNKVYSNGPTIISGTNRGLGIWFDSAGTGNIIRYNTSYGNTGTGIFVEVTSGAQVYYNTSYSNVGFTNASGVDISGRCCTGGVDYSANNNQVYQNTIWGNSVGIRVRGDSNGLDVSNNTVKNNISYGNLGYQFDAEEGGDNNSTGGAGNVYTNNAFSLQATNFVKWSSIGKSTYSSLDTAYGSAMNNIQTDPLLTNPGTGDFTLQSTSPAINTALSLGTTYQNGLNPISTWPSNVLTLNQDQNGPAWDIGAYVYPESTTLPVASPVTVSGTTTIGSTLTGSYTYSDAASHPESTSTFRWLRASTSGGSYSAISGATSSTYVLTSSDIGQYLKFEVTPVSTIATGTAVLSSATQIPALPVVVSTYTSGGSSASAISKFFAQQAVTQTSSSTNSGQAYNFGITTLKNGSRGASVKELQRFLNNNLTLGLVIDGILGPKTIVVIKAWQKAHGLVPDGLVGVKTKGVMLSL